MKKSKGRIVFEVINVIVLSLLSFACLFPLLNILAMSFSSSTAVAAGKVSIFPVEFNLYAYDYVVGKADFWKSLLRSMEKIRHPCGVRRHHLRQAYLSARIGKALGLDRVKTMKIRS